MTILSPLTSHEQQTNVDAPRMCCRGKNSCNVKNGILDVIGKTPIVSLPHLFNHDRSDINLCAKLEYLNPGGSAKDRSGYRMMLNALKLGKINDDSVIIESSSGNLGIALAQVCLMWKLRFICVIDPKTTQANKDLLKAYGAEIDCVTEPDAITGEFLQARINRVNQLLNEIPNSYRPNQYSNINNPEGHKPAMLEIVDSLGFVPDYVFCAVSTCGTVRGYSECARTNNFHTKIIAVDAVGSVIFGKERKKRLIPGHGAAVVPDLYYDGIADDFVQVTDSDCVVGCRRLLRKEGIFAGGSTGAIVSAINIFKSKIEKGSSVVFVVHDRGERYLETVYSDQWVKEKLGIDCELLTKSIIQEETL